MRVGPQIAGVSCAVALALLGGWIAGAEAGYVNTLTAMSGLVSYWNLNEQAGVTAADAVTSDAVDGNNTGTYAGVGITVGAAGPRPEEGWAGFGADNRAASFTKIPGDQLQMAQVSGYAGRSDLSLVGWIRITDPDVAALHNLFGGLQTSDSSRYVFTVDHAPTGLRGVARRADGDSMMLGPSSVGGESVWHFLAMTYAGGTTCKLYWDGLEVGQSQRSEPAGLAEATALVFGRDMQDPTRSLHGQIDELAVFDRALAGEEIDRLFLAAKGQLPYEPGSVATAPYFQTAMRLGGLRNHWRFSETSGTTAADVVGGNHGTFVRMGGAPVTLGVAGPTPSEGHDGYAFSGFEADNRSVQFVWNTGANYMETLDGDVIGPPGTGVPFSTGVQALTMSLWFKNHFDGEGYVAGFAKPGSSNRYVFSVYSPNATDLRFYVTASNNEQIASSDIPVDDLGAYEWHHLVQVWDGAEKRLRVYIDGQERVNETNALMNATLATPYGFHIGRDVYASIRNLGGFVDEVSLFDRALSADEALELYDAAFFHRIPGDADNNGVVDAADAAVLAAYWLTPTDKGFAAADFNFDGRVDDLDASILAAHWQYGASAAAVPEPAAWALGVGCACLVGIVRRGRRRAW